MVAWLPLTRRAVKLAPIALEVARQLDKQLRPHVLAYRKAKEMDGFVARFTDEDGHTHWLVFPVQGAAPVAAFPPLTDAQVEQARTTLDVGQLTHHSELPEAKAMWVAQSVTRRSGRTKRREGDDPQLG
jgi:hypothetical protein